MARRRAEHLRHRARDGRTRSTPNFYSDRFFGGFIPWVHRDLPLPREACARRDIRLSAHGAESDARADRRGSYFPATAAAITYSKTALWLHTLERLLGWPTLQRILATFFERWRYRHPAPADFFAVANEISGRDLTWFFDQVHRSANEFDYGVSSLTSVPVEIERPR